MVCQPGRGSGAAQTTDHPSRELAFTCTEGKPNAQNERSLGRFLGEGALTERSLGGFFGEGALTEHSRGRV